MKNDAPSRTRLMSSLLLGALVAGGCVWAYPVWSNDEEDEIAEAVGMAGSAKVPIGQAIEAATAQVPGTVIEAELEEVPRVTWEFEIVTPDGKVMEVLVDKDTGAVVGTKEKKPDEEKEQADKDGEKKMGKMMHQRGAMEGHGCCGVAGENE